MPINNLKGIEIKEGMRVKCKIKTPLGDFIDVYTIIKDNLG